MYSCIYMRCVIIICALSTIYKNIYNYACKLILLTNHIPLYTYTGCAVCSLDLTTETAQWQEAVQRAILEIRRLGHFGLSEGELGRYKQAVLAEAGQAMAQASQASNEVGEDERERVRIMTLCIVILSLYIRLYVYLAF